MNLLPIGYEAAIEALTETSFELDGVLHAPVIDTLNVAYSLIFESSFMTFLMCFCFIAFGVALVELYGLYKAFKELSVLREQYKKLATANPTPEAKED